MKDFDRRCTVALGLGAAAAVLAAPRVVAAETYGPSYGPDDGQQRAPGVQMVADIGKRPSELPGYKAVMVCHCLDGELHIDHGGGKRFVAEKGDVWTCVKGMPEAATNGGGTVAIVRVIDLLA